MSIMLSMLSLDINTKKKKKKKKKKKLQADAEKKEWQQKACCCFGLFLDSWYNVLDTEVTEVF